MHSYRSRLICAIVSVLLLLSSCGSIDPLPSEVMTTAPSAQYGDLWLKYLSLRDSLGPKAQFKKYLEDQKMTEEQFCKKSLIDILKDAGVANPEETAEACFKENFNATV